MLIRGQLASLVSYTLAMIDLAITCMISIGHQSRQHGPVSSATEFEYIEYQSPQWIRIEDQTERKDWFGNGPICTCPSLELEG
jgi:hypothetical protein